MACSDCQIDACAAPYNGGSCSCLCHLDDASAEAIVRRKADARDAAKWRALRPPLAAWAEAEAAYEAARRALSGNDATSCAAFERARFARVEKATVAYEAIEAALRGEP
jgi:hypothetical protein